MKQGILLRSGIAALLLCLVAAVAATAGTVYVPIIQEFEIDGKTVTPHVLVTNTDFAQVHGFHVLFLPSGSDGTERPETEEPAIMVAPGATVLVNAGPPQGGTGLLEIAADQELIIDARLVISDSFGGGLPDIIDLPVLASDDVIPAGETAYLQGLERTRLGTRTDIAIINVGKTTAQCEASLFKSRGTKIQNTVVIHFPPLSQQVFPDAFASMGETFLVEGRLSLTCDEPFYTLAAVSTEDLEVARIVIPSESGGSKLLRPGDGASLILPGVFFEPVPGASVVDFDIPLEPGVPYTQVDVDFDLFLGSWHSNLFHNVFGLRRKGLHLYYNMILRADNKRTLFHVGNNTELKDPSVWQERTNYHIHVGYDTIAGTLTLEISQAGAILDTFTGPLVHRDVSDNGFKVNVVFGLLKVADNAFFPPWGWRYSNLSVLATQ